MKITGVRTAALADTPPASPTKAPDHALIELATDAGLIGLAVADGAVAPIVETLVRERLSGADPRAAMGLWEWLKATIPVDLEVARARAALDIAMWDLKAKANDEPLWKTLGGERPRARAHLAWDGPTNGPAMIDWLGRMHAKTGIRSASLPASGDADTDIDLLSDVQSAVQATVPDASLMLAFDGTDRSDEAIRRIRAVEAHFDLTWVRSPTRRGDFRGARRVVDAVRAAVCLGHGLPDIESYLPYLQKYAANVIEIDIAVVGISGCVQMADAAFGFELPVVLTDYPGHVPVQLFTALPTAMSAELAYRASLSGVVACGLLFEQGRVVAGTRPGHGMSIDRAPSHAAGAPA